MKSPTIRTAVCPRVLEAAERPEHHGPSEGDGGSGGFETQLHPERPIPLLGGERQLLLEPPRRTMSAATLRSSVSWSTAIAAGYQGGHEARGRLSLMRSTRGSTAVFVVLAVVASACSVPRLEDYDERPLAQTSFLYASDGS